MNCACNRYKTCTDCRSAYKESRKYEQNIQHAIANLKQAKELGGTLVSLEEIIKLLECGTKS